MKVLEYLGLGGKLPMAGVSVLGGLVRMGVNGMGGVAGMGNKDPWGGLRRFWSVYGPWAVRNGLRMGVDMADGKKKKKKNDNNNINDRNPNTMDNMASFLCVYWEEWMDKDIALLRDHLGIVLPPDMRDMRRRDREVRRDARGQVQA